MRNDYRTRILPNAAAIDARQWNRLAAVAAGRERAQPFLRHEFFDALERTGCVGPRTGWKVQHLLVEDSTGPAAIVPLYRKSHSYGEYVFDWAWADAWQRHGLRYYPKWLVAVPFTPVPGARIVGRDASARRAAIDALLSLARGSSLSSLHVLFPLDAEAALLREAGLLLRHGVQFHWRNDSYPDFDAFLATLAQPKRKKIRAERRRVADAGVRIRRVQGTQIRASDWRFFVRCYEATYAAHLSMPYLNREFFEHIGETMPEHLLLVVAELDGRPIASALFVHDDERLYGRYWGAIADVPMLHFELCYYQAIEIAIDMRLRVIEGGAQGEHKLARGFEAVPTTSAHWLAEPAFADAVEHFLVREGRHIGDYLDELRERSPYRADVSPGS